MRDVEITLTYGNPYGQVCSRKRFKRSACHVGWIGPALLRRQATEDGVDLNSALGLRIEARTLFYEHTRRYRTVKQLAAITSRQLFEEFAAAAYLGGRNECFICGPTPESVYYDYDLPAAYTTACVRSNLSITRVFGLRKSSKISKFVYSDLLMFDFVFPTGRVFRVFQFEPTMV